MTETSADRLPTSMLFYFFADRVALPKGRKRERVQAGIVPRKQGRAVQTVPLAGLLLAAAFWDLRERSILRLELKQVLWHRFIRVRLQSSWLREHLQPFGLAELQRASDVAPRLPGLEGQILAHLYYGTLGQDRLAGALARRQLETMEPRKREEVEARIAETLAERVPAKDPQALDLRSVVSSVVAGSSDLSQDLRVMEQLQRSAAALGYAAPTVIESRGFLGKRTPKTAYTPYCEKIAALQGAFERRLVCWRQFQVDERKLASELIGQCIFGVRYNASAFS